MHKLHYMTSRDSDMIKEWRRDRRSFNKSMEKVSRRNEGTLTMYKSRFANLLLRDLFIR